MESKIENELKPLRENPEDTVEFSKIPIDEEVKWMGDLIPLKLFMYDYELERENYKSLYQEEVRIENSLKKDPRFLCTDSDIEQVKSGNFTKTEQHIDISEQKEKEIEKRLNDDKKQSNDGHKDNPENSGSETKTGEEIEIKESELDEDLIK